MSNQPQLKAQLALRKTLDGINVNPLLLKLPPIILTTEEKDALNQAFNETFTPT
jgi:hypothetical protein